MSQQARQTRLRDQLSDFVILESDLSSEEDENGLRQDNFQSFFSLEDQKIYGSCLQLNRSQNLVNKQIFSKYLFKKRINKRKSLKLFKNQLMIKALQLSITSSSLNLNQQASLEKTELQIGDEQKIDLSNIDKFRNFEQNTLIKQKNKNNQVQNSQVQKQLLQIEQKYEKHFKNSEKTKIKNLSQNQFIQEEIKNKKTNEFEKKQKSKSEGQPLLKNMIQICLFVCMIAIIQAVIRICNKGF